MKFVLWSCGASSKIHVAAEVSSFFTFPQLSVCYLHQFLELGLSSLYATMRCMKHDTWRYISIDISAHYDCFGSKLGKFYFKIKNTYKYTSV